MNTALVCPECKTRSVPDGYYLCSRCEKSMARAAARSPKRVRHSAGKRPARQDSGEIAVHAVHLRLRPPQRPLWLQYAIATVLVSLGFACLWAVRPDSVNLRDGRSMELAPAARAVHNVNATWERILQELQ